MRYCIFAASHRMTFLIVVCTVLVSYTISRAESQETLRPNIILMMADDLGWGDTGFNGDTIIKTPHLDAMAQSGIRFSRFYSGAPVCSPTRGSCLTGRHPWRYGIWYANAGHLRKEEIALPELLHEQGYVCGHFGKWHLGTLHAEKSGKAGRDTARNFMTPNMTGFDSWFSTEYAVPTWNPGTASDINPYYENGKLATENLEGCDSRVLMDRAIPFIQDAAKKNTPFFAVIWFHAPHEPIVAGPEFKAMYSQYSPGEQEFYGVVTALDVQVGRLQQTLKDLNVDKNTMIWFASDNGPEGNDGDSGKTRGSAGPFRGRKRSLWQGGIRVPAFVTWPGTIEAGVSSDLPCSTLDYFPTTMDLLGLQPERLNRPIDGVSLKPLIVDGTMTQRPKPIPFETQGRFGSGTTRGSHHISLIDNQFVFLSDLDDKNNELLFDIIKDPSETTNVAATYPEVVAAMRQQMIDFRESCVRSLRGEDYKQNGAIGGFVPDKDDIHPGFRGSN